MIIRMIAVVLASLLAVSLLAQCMQGVVFLSTAHHLLACRDDKCKVEEIYPSRADCDIGMSEHIWNKEPGTRLFCKRAK